MNIETRKAILLFLVLFVTWQVLYPLGLDTLLGYAIVLVVVVGFLALDKQSLAKVGLRRPSGWTGYVVIGCVLAAIFVTYLFVVGSVLYSNAPPISFSTRDLLCWGRSPKCSLRSSPSPDHRAC